MATIRQLTPNDANLFRALRVEAVTNAPSAFTESLAEINKRSDADYANLLQQHANGNFVLGAFDDDHHLIGAVGFYRAEFDKQFHKGTLWGMYVAPDGRQNGVGRALMTEAIARAKTVGGIVYLMLCVATTNRAATHLYESLGFQPCGVERRALRIDGVYVDEMMMQLMLV